jgi:hypothetical protein
MGMNGWLGVRFITPTDILMILKARPASYRYLTGEQRLAAPGAVPCAAQQQVSGWFGRLRGNCAGG